MELREQKQGKESLASLSLLGRGPRKDGKGIVEDKREGEDWASLVSGRCAHPGRWLPV